MLWLARPFARSHFTFGPKRLSVQFLKCYLNGLNPHTYINILVRFEIKNSHSKTTFDHIYALEGLNRTNTTLLNGSNHGFHASKIDWVSLILSIAHRFFLFLFLSLSLLSFIHIHYHSFTLCPSLSRSLSLSLSLSISSFIWSRSFLNTYIHTYIYNNTQTKKVYIFHEIIY